MEKQISKTFSQTCGLFMHPQMLEISGWIQYIPQMAILQANKLRIREAYHENWGTRCRINSRTSVADPHPANVEALTNGFKSTLTEYAEEIKEFDNSLNMTNSEFVEVGQILLIVCQVIVCSWLSFFCCLARSNVTTGSMEMPSWAHGDTRQTAHCGNDPILEALISTLLHMPGEELGFPLDYAYDPAITNAKQLISYLEKCDLMTDKYWRPDRMSQGLIDETLLLMKTKGFLEIYR